MNGTCQTDCTIRCNAGYFDCDGDVTNGCECGGGIDKCHDYGCNGAACVATAKPMGTDCSSDCITNAQCNAQGQCNGTKARDGVQCAGGPTNCTITPTQCLDGACACPPGGNPAPPDFAKPPIGTNHGGCSVASNAGPSGILAMLLLLGGALLFRRRRA